MNLACSNRYGAGDPASDRAELELLCRLSHRLSESLDVYEVAQRALDDICDVVGAVAGTLFVAETGSKRLRLVAVSGREQAAIRALDTQVNLAVGQGLAGWVADRRQVALVDDVRQDGRWLVVAGLDDWTVSALCVPLMSRDELIGVLSLGSAHKGFFGPDHLRLAESVGATVAMAIANARLYQAEREHRQLAEALAEAAAVVNSALYLDQVLDRILEQVEKVVAGTAFNIMLIEDDRARVVRWRGYDNLGIEEWISTFSIPLARYPSLVHMANTGQPILLSDTRTAGDWVLLSGSDWLRSYVAVPIRVTGLTVGFLNVDGTRTGQFGPDDAYRLEIFAHYAATAVENAQLYQELRSYAESLEKRVEERTAQLQSQYARLEAILDGIAEGIIVVDAEGKIVQANPVAQRWLTRTLSPQDAERLQEATLSLAQRAAQRPELVLELRGLDLQLSAAPVVAGELAERSTAVVTVHDVTHLRTLDRMKSQFVSTVSHELRTPITTIKLYVALLRRCAPDKRDEYLDALSREADHQARLLEDILQLLRIDAGRMDLRLEPTPLNPLIDGAVGSYRLLAEENGLLLQRHLADPSPLVYVDAERTTWVLRNLLGNAIRYTQQGGRVEIVTRREELAGRSWATVTVSDTGIGISEDELPHIFERFYRGERPRQMQMPGTGLGLAIVKEIVELHGGRVTVTSRVDEGATFIVWLPLAE